MAQQQPVETDLVASPPDASAAPDAGAAPLPTADAAGASDHDPSAAESPATLPIPRWAFNLIGHVLAALLGLAIGYLILSQLKPETFPLPW
jgi:hypothetical protein